MFSLTVWYLHCPLLSIISVRNHNVLAKTKKILLFMSNIYRRILPRETMCLYKTRKYIEKNRIFYIINLMSWFLTVTVFIKTQIFIIVTCLHFCASLC